MGRSLWGAAAIAVGWLLAAACIGMWLAAGASGWRAAAGSAGLAIAGAWAAWDWRRTPAGRLAWDRAGWSFQPEGQGAEAGGVSVALDLQRVLLVRWRAPHRRHWFWLERGSDPGRWDALRRAVYSRPDDDAPSGAEPPPSTP